jgi:double-stranded uracil-DNA glycosylase
LTAAAVPGATLPDWLTPGLEIVSVGLNPSPNSVRAGFAFATPQNRFWKALNASGLIDEVLVPGPAAMQRLLDHYRIGSTDVVKRPTPGAAQLRAQDFRLGAPLLTEKLLACAPRLVWFHGKLAYRHYLKCSGADAVELAWGLQPREIGNSRVFVTPNPSPANAGFSLGDLVLWYRRLAELNRGIAR